MTVIHDGVNKRIFSLWMPGFNGANEKGEITEGVVAPEDLGKALEHFDHWYGETNVDYAETPLPANMTIDKNGDLKKIAGSVRQWNDPE